MGDRMFGFQGWFVSFCSKLFDTLVLGLLWILCSLPLFTVGASATALYYAVVKSVKNDHGYAVREFFRCFKKNFRQATILWLILVLLFMLMRLNTGILMAHMEGSFGLLMIGFYTAVCVYLGIMACYMFPCLSRFEMPVGWFIRISMYMGIRYFLTTMAIALVFLCMAGLVVKAPVLFLVVPGPTAFLISEFMERVLKKHMPAEEKKAESGSDS